MVDSPTDMEDRQRKVLRRIGFRSVAVVIGLGLGLLIIEGGLHLFYRLLSRPIQHFAFDRYDLLPGGMYLQERRTRMRVMRVNSEIRTFSHGYWWTHRTDDLGFRNPPEIKRKDVLLLGDSMIYGHGVEQEQTVAHFLREVHGEAAYSLAQQGQCLYDHYLQLRLFLDQLQPRTVLLFVFYNDFRDLENRRRAREIARRPESTRFDYDVIRADLASLQHQSEPLLARALYSLASARVVKKWLRARALEKGRPGSDPPSTTPSGSDPAKAKKPTPATEQTQTRPAGPVANKTRAERRQAKARRRPDLVPILRPARFKVLAQYYRRTLPELEKSCRDRGARLVVVQLLLVKPERGSAHLEAQEKVCNLLAEIADRHDLEFYHTRELFARRKDCFLPHDGHFNEAGNRRLADYLHTKILAPNPAEPEALGR